MHVRPHGTKQKEPGSLSLAKRPAVNAVAHGNWDVTTSAAASRSYRLRCAGSIRIKRFVEENSKQALVGT